MYIQALSQVTEEHVLEWLVDLIVDPHSGTEIEDAIGVQICEKSKLGLC